MITTIAVPPDLFWLALLARYGRVYDPVANDAALAKREVDRLRREKFNARFEKGGKK